MKESVALLHEDLEHLRRFIPTVQLSSSGSSGMDCSVDLSGDGNRPVSVASSLFRDLSHSYPQIQYIRRLRAISDAPEAIDSYVSQKRWVEATSIYLRALKLFSQLDSFPSASSPSSQSSFQIPIDARPFITFHKAKLEQSKMKLVKGAKTFLARSKLFHRVALDDNLKNSTDLVQLLQSWRLQLEQAKDVHISVMLSMIELNPSAGVAASLEHCSHSFASALASLALIDNLSPSQLFQQFLKLRLHTMRHTIDFTKSEEARKAPFEAVKFALCEWIRSIQWTMYLIHSIFTVSNKYASGDAKSALKSSSTLKSNEPVTQLPLLNLVLGAILGRQYGLNISDAKLCIGEEILANLRNPLQLDFIHSSSTQWIQMCINLLPGALPYEISNLSKNIDPKMTILAQIQSGNDLSVLESSLAYQIEHPLVKYAVNENENQSLFAFPTSSPTWSGATTPNRSGSATPRSGTSSSSFWTTPSSHYGTPTSSLSRVHAAALLASAQIPKWKSVSTRVCGQLVDLWTTFFHNLFLQHAQHIVQISFQQITLEAQMAALLKFRGHRGLLLSRVLSDNKVQKIGGEDVSIDESALGEYIWSTGDGWTTTTTTKVGDQMDHAHGLTPALRSLISIFDGKLVTVMQDLRPLIVIEDDVVKMDEETGLPVSMNSSTDAIENDTQVVRRRYRPTTKEATLPILRAEIQQNCVSLVSRLCASFSRHIEQCTSEPDSHKDLVSKLHKALFIGRLARALDTHSAQLRMILWQLEWKNTQPVASPFSISSPSFPTAKISGSKWMDRLTRKPLAAVETLSTASSSLPSSAIQHSTATSSSLQQVYHLAYSKWIQTVVQELSRYFDELVTSSSQQTVPVRSNWSNVNLGKASETEVLVPAHPSTQMLKWLREIVAIVYRAGAHIVDRFVLEYLVYCLSNVAMDKFSDAIRELKAETATQRDLALQLWFDIRFVFDVLSKRHLNHPFFQQLAIQNTQKQKWDDVAEVMGFATKIEALITQLKSKLDPLEASFNAPHITKNAKASILQHSALLGLLMAKTLETSKRPTLTFNPGDASTANSMACVQNVPRFATLPVTTPTLASLREMQGNALSASATNSLAGDQATESSSSTTLSSATSNSEGDASSIVGGKSRQALEAAGAFWGKISEGVKGGWFS